MFGALAFLIFVSLVLGGYALATVLGGREEARQALERRLSTMTGLGSGMLRSGVLKDQRLSTVAIVNAVLGRISVVTPLARMMRRAGLKKRVGEVLLYVPLLACAGCLLVTLVTGRPLLGVIVGAVAGASPLLIVRRIGHRRAVLFAEQLPDALDLVRAALQAGHGLMAAMGVVAEEFPDPIAQEFRDVTEEVRLGLPLRDALANLAERVDNPDIPLLQVGVLVGQDIGGNLAEVLDNISYTIRERFKVQRETRVLTAQGRLSGGVLTALPFLAALGMSVINPEYFTPMLSDPRGQHMILYGLVSLLLGHLVIRRLVRVKV